MNVSNHWTPMFCDWPVECVQSLDPNILWMTCCSHTTLHYCILFFIYWIELIKVRIFIFYLTIFLLQYFFKEKIGAIFLLGFLFVYDLQMYICILYVNVFCFILVLCICILYVNDFFLYFGMYIDVHLYFIC